MRNKINEKPGQNNHYKYHMIHNQKEKHNSKSQFDLGKVQRNMIGISFLVLLITAGIYIVTATGNNAGVHTDNVQSNQNETGSSQNLNEAGSVPNQNKSVGMESSTVISGFRDPVPPLAANSGSPANSANKMVSVISSGIEEGTEENDIYFPLKIEPEKANEVIATTTTFFTERIPFLQQALNDSGFFYKERLLDPDTATRAYIIAKDENCADHLNGYFYYLFDTKGSTNIVSPFILNISLLFEEENRKTVIDSGTFAEPKHSQALKQSLIAVLGTNYTEEVFTFIMNEYIRTFRSRINGDALQTPIFKLQVSKLEVVFHNSFLTYVEFFLEP